MNKITLIVVFLTLIAYGLSFLVPLSGGWAGTYDAFHWTLANTVLYTMLHISAAVLFLVGMSAYKSTLRAAYGAISLGIVLVGAGLAHVVVLTIFGLIQTPWVQYGGVLLPFLGAGLSIYLGTRAMAKLINMKSWLTTTSLIFPLALIGAAIVSLLPHAAASSSELSFDIFNALSVWNMVLYAASFVIALRMKGHVGDHYKKSMTWLAAGLMGSVVITIFVLATTFTSGIESQGSLIDSIVIIGGLLYLMAGYSFAKTRDL